MKYIASVRDGETKLLEIIEREYDRKQDFYNDLRECGYRVRFITTEEKFDEDCEKYNQMWEENKRVKKARYATDKEEADKYGISVAHYRRAWKAYMKAIKEDKTGYLVFEDYIKIYK